MAIYNVTYFSHGSRAVLKHKRFEMENLQGAKLMALAHLPKLRSDVRICNTKGELLSMLMHRDNFASRWSDRMDGSIESL